MKNDKIYSFEFLLGDITMFSVYTRYGILISHSHARNNNIDYYSVERMINESNILWRNLSVPIHDRFDTNSRVELKKSISEQIRLASIVVIIGGMYVAHSEWIQFEVKITEEYDKPILLIRPHGNTNLPNYANRVATKVVNWNTNSIINGIKELL